MKRALFAALLLFSCERPAQRPKAKSAAEDAYRRPDLLVAALGLHPGEIVAEIGAGGGYLTPRLLDAVSPGGKVVATDIDRDALFSLRARIGKSPAAEARLVSPTEPGLEAKTYDLILLCQVDHLLSDRVAYLKKLGPALRPGGRIAISNSDRHREALKIAASSAGYRLTFVSAGLPAQFLAFLQL